MSTPTARPHAAIEALKRLARTRSTQPCSLLNALFEIGLRGGAHASPAEWALIDLADLMFGELSQIEGR